MKIVVLLITALLSLGLAKTSIKPTNCPPETPVNIPDIWFERALKEFLDIDPITPKPLICSDLQSLTRLEIPHDIYFRISSLEGIEYAVNLEELILPKLAARYPVGHFVVSLEPLANLHKLRHLEIYLGRFDDLSPLANLQNLEYLELEGQRVQDISPLADLHKLEHVAITNQQITHIPALPKLKNLHHLDLQDNHIRDISGVNTLTGLTYLNLWNNYVNDISPLSGMQTLERVNLSRNSITNPQLTDIPALEYLSLGYSGITDLSFIEGLTEGQLVSIGLTHNLIYDLSPLSQSNPTFHIGLGKNCLDLRSNSNDAQLAERLFAQGWRLHFGDNIIDDRCHHLQENPLSDGDFVDPKDPVLLKALMLATGFYRFTTADIAKVTVLDLLRPCNTLKVGNVGSASIFDTRCASDLSALQHAANLQHLMLATQDLNNLSLLSELPRLQSLLLYRFPYNYTIYPAYDEAICFDFSVSGPPKHDLTSLLRTFRAWNYQLEDAVALQTYDLFSKLHADGVKIILGDAIADSVCIPENTTSP
ncbi:MAG: leucine-rich repeat domain-containing protein [Deinococcota bacterium]